MRVATLLILMWICSHSVALSQESVNEADSISYDHYLRKEWRQLAKYGETATQAGYDFYYLNLRTGIAFYHLKKWHIAKKWLQKAIGNNIDDTLAREYLYWIRLFTNRPTEAARIYTILPKEAQYRINNPPRKLLSSIVIEGGLRTANKPDSINTFNYSSLKLSHKFAPSFQLHHAYSYLNQEYLWGRYRQQNYYVAPVYHLSEGLSVSASLNLMKYDRGFDYLGDTVQYNDTTVVISDRAERTIITNADYHSQYTGSFELQGYYAHIAISKTFGKAHLSLLYANYRDQFDTTFDETIDSLFVTQNFSNGEPVSTTRTEGVEVNQLESSGSYHQEQFGLLASFTFPMKAGRFVIIGIETQLVFAEEQYLHFIPFFTLQAHPRISFSGSYLSKGNYPLGVLGGSLVLNNYDRYHHRFSLTGKFQLKSYLRLFSTFQWESLDDDFLTGKYSTLGFFLGVQWVF